jgi:class 3 adenylate cyclase
MSHVLVWDIETKPDLQGFAAANGQPNSETSFRSTSTRIASRSFGGALAPNSFSNFLRSSGPTGGQIDMTFFRRHAGNWWKLSCQSRSGEIERMGRLRRFLPPQVADLIVASGSEKQLESHRWEITALFCDLRGFTSFTESADAEDVMALLRDYHAAIGEIIIKYNGALERYAGDGVMVVFNDPVPERIRPPAHGPWTAWCHRSFDDNLELPWARNWLRDRFCARLRYPWDHWLEGRFDYAAIGTVSNVASRLCDEAKPGQILISPRVLMKVENFVKVEAVGEFELKGIRRLLAAYNVLAAIVWSVCSFFWKTGLAQASNAGCRTG